MTFATRSRSSAGRPSHRCLGRMDGATRQRRHRRSSHVPIPLRRKSDYASYMSWSFSIGHILGSDLRVHATFFLLLAWIGTATWLAEGPAAAFANLAFVLALFACVVAHEFGHALMARRYGVRTPDITLLPTSGMARLERIPENPREEIGVALASCQRECPANKRCEAPWKEFTHTAAKLAGGSPS